ncbi:MAG: efflux RND transporter periplasmic adaptor subunit [Halioglobus sp.]
MSIPLWWRISTLLLLSGTLLGAVGCGENNGTAITPESGIPVTLATSEQRTVPYVLTAIGNVEPVASVDVESRVDGQITDVLIGDGENVVKDQLLFQIDPRPFQIQIQQIEANLVRDQALLKIATAQDKRYSDLLAKKFISQDGYAEIAAKRDIAAAALKTDEGNLANAKLQLDFTRITAPISGRLGKVELWRGNLVKANDARPLVVLNQVDPIYVSFAVPERALVAIREESAESRAIARDSTVPRQHRNRRGRCTELFR